MNDGLELAYLGVEVPDPASLTPFFGDVIGLAPGAGAPPGAVAWRNDDRAQRVTLHPGPANDISYLGLEAADGPTFDAVAARLRRAGFSLAVGGADACAARRVRRLAHTMAPWGSRLELVEGLAEAASPYASPLVPGGFLTRGVGFGHVVLATTAFEESQAFVTAGLGLEQSDWLQTEIGDGIELEVHFYHCNQRHHSLALARAPFELPQRLHHFMVEVNDRDDVGAAFDRAWAAELAIPNGLGRHDNDHMFSFYVASPAGFLVEVGYGGRVVTADWADNRRYDRISAWGHQPLGRP